MLFNRYCEIYTNFPVFKYMYTYWHTYLFACKSFDIGFNWNHQCSLYRYQSSEPELTYPIVPAIVYRKQSTSENDERVTDAIEPSQCSATAWSV